MSMSNETKTKLNDIANELDNHVRALSMLGDLVGGCREQIHPENIYYLLDPIIQRQKVMITQLENLN
jgi:hypothetical protein